MSAPEVKVGQRWKRSEWSNPSGWIVKRVQDGVVTLSDPDRKFNEIDRPVGDFSEWILVGDVPSRPAPPESRWLDPASVTERAGHPMRVCSKVCPFPSRNPSGPGALCAYCASKLPFYGSPHLPPSTLTSVLRWRSLPGGRWSRPGRTYSASLIVWLREHGARAAWQGRVLRASRVSRVRALGDRPGRDPALLAAKWVRA